MFKTLMNRSRVEKEIEDFKKVTIPDAEETAERIRDGVFEVLGFYPFGWESGMPLELTPKQAAKLGEVLTSVNMEAYRYAHGDKCAVQELEMLQLDPKWKFATRLFFWAK